MVRSYVMDENFINNLPFLVKQGKISAEEGRNILWTEIHKHPFFYGIGMLTEDQRSEFLIWMRNNLQALITKFREGPVSFRSFARVCVWRTVRVWLRREVKKNARNNCLPENLLAEFTYDADKSEDVTAKSIETARDRHSYTSPKIPEILSKKKKQILRNLVHIAACKACNEIDETMTARLAKFLEIPQKAFEEEIELLRKETVGKKDTRQKVIEKRNRAFFFHKKFEFELSRMDRSNISYETILKSYRKNTENWKTINEQLTHKYQAYPSLGQISRLTGINERRISFYLNHHAKRKDLISFISCPQEEDEDNRE